MPTNPPDKVQREIEELLDKLDTFVPEERLASKIRNRRRQQRENAEPNALQRAFRRVSQVSLGQLMLVGVVCMLIGYFFRGPIGPYATWLTLGGLAITVIAFILSIATGGSHRTTVGARRVQKRWRGQVIEYSEPSRMERFREWIRRRGRR